MTAKAN